MNKGKLALDFLFGPNANLIGAHKHRTITIKFPAASMDDHERKLVYPSQDGLILTLLKRIEALEAKAKK